eukprot:675601-Rhodomonas_salina.1
MAIRSGWEATLSVLGPGRIDLNAVGAGRVLCRTVSPYQQAHTHFACNFCADAPVFQSCYEQSRCIPGTRVPGGTPGT